MKILCECNSFCSQVINISLEEIERNKIGQSVVVIVDGCSPEPTDVLISKETGYSIYREKKNGT